jgi:hypothetical protein
VPTARHTAVTGQDSEDTAVTPDGNDSFTHVVVLARCVAEEGSVVVVVVDESVEMGKAPENEGRSTVRKMTA